MKTATTLKSILALLALLIMSLSYGQTISTDYKEINQQKSESLSKPGTVINKKMIARFNELYDKIEVISWQKIMSQSSFDHAKLYLNAYSNINLNDTKSGELTETINKKLIETDNNLSYELTKTLPIALRDSVPIFYK